ncbi:MAG: class I SAM-dependent methyltransferase [Acidimicrobiia bacterium]
MSTKYETIGATYARTRRTDPRIAASIWAALGDARTVVNVGAGTGSYEPADRRVVAVEPSARMIGQRPPGAPPAVQGVAEAMPFATASFDAALAVLTMHHWTDLGAGLAEMRRVAERQVLFFFEPEYADLAWIVVDYFPEILDQESERNAPGVADIAQHLDVVSCEPVPVPADCIDGFGGCYWNRPEMYLDPDVQRGMSCFAQMEAHVLARGIDRLRTELADGTWDAKYGELRTRPEHNLGYHVVVAR